MSQSIYYLWVHKQEHEESKQINNLVPKPSNLSVRSQTNQVHVFYFLLNEIIDLDRTTSVI